MTPLARAPRAAAATLALGASLAAHATNGMLLEGYGPIATGMGGASTAVENGLAAAANNPATLGLMGAGSRAEVAVGDLGPRVSSRAGPVTSSDSGGRHHFMPAAGFGRSDGTLSYGIAVFAQGGMGTDYDANSFLAMGSGAPVRSELGVGRVMLPVAWQATPALTLGASFDFVWASLDMRMAASGAQLGALVTGADGNLAMALPALGGAPWARIDFSDNSKFSGAARGHGLAAKLGLVYQASPALRVGASYHSRTHLKNLTTGATGASLSAPGFGDTGTITVLDFQMPAELALGAAWQATPSLLVAADVKRIGWAASMRSFRLRYDSGAMGGSVSFALPQDWKNQTVLALGAAQRLDARWVVRAGLNLAANPVPDAEVSPLFPATVRNHVTLGAGYALAGGSALDASMAYAPKVTVNTPSGVAISHRF
jgi:long-chain fatty acid transport protein